MLKILMIMNNLPRLIVLLNINLMRLPNIFLNSSVMMLLLMMSNFLMICSLLRISILMRNYIMLLIDHTMLFFINSWRLRVKYINFLNLMLFVISRTVSFFVCKRACTLRSHVLNLISHVIVLTSLGLSLILSMPVIGW